MIEDLQQTKYHDGALENMNLKKNKNFNDKKKIHTKDFQEKYMNTLKS